jgi:hypothetical protein
MSITRAHDKINTPMLSLKKGDGSVCFSVGEYTPALRLRDGIATQALLKCWCVHTGIASPYGSVAMVQADAKLYPVIRKGKVKGYPLYLGSTYNSFHATRAAGLNACKTARPAKPTNPETCPPPLHVQGLLPRFSKKRGEWMYEGRVRQPGSDAKVYVGSSINTTYMASSVASAKGQDVSACKCRKCLRRAPDDWMERFRLMADLFKE